MEESFDEPIGWCADDYCARLGDTLQPRSNIRGFADGQGVRIGSVAQVTHDGQTGVNGDANLQRLL
jgi:hypothetical protein